MEMQRLGQENLLTENLATGVCLYPLCDGEMALAEMLYRRNAVIPEQTHSLNVGMAMSRWQKFPDTDALVTFEPGIPVGVRTADCVPVLIYAPDVKGVAAVHAGWRGSLGGIVDNTVDLLERHGASAMEMIVAFGPSVSKGNYEVDTELADRFVQAGFGDFVSCPQDGRGKPHIDLQGVNVARLLRRGVRQGNIRMHKGCTYGSVASDGRPLYQSYRREKDNAGRMLTYISLLNPDSRDIMRGDYGI